MELTEMERRNRFERFVGLGNKIIKKNLLYIPTKELDLGADITNMEQIMSESTPYADRMKKASKYTTADIIEVKKFIDLYNHNLKAGNFIETKERPLTVTILLRDLGVLREEYRILDQHEENPDVDKYWIYGVSKTFYMINGLIKDGIIEVENTEDKAVHGGVYKTRLITNIKAPIQELLEKAQPKKVEQTKPELSEEEINILNDIKMEGSINIVADMYKKTEEEIRQILEKVQQPLEKVKQTKPEPNIIDANKQNEEFKAKHPELQALEKLDQTEPDTSEDEKDILEDIKSGMDRNKIASRWSKTEEEIHAIFIQSKRK